MATEADHIRLANKNHAALLRLLDDVDKFPEWVATISFYKAVHVIEAVFAHDLGFHSMSHDDRIQSLKIIRYKKIFLNYGHLLTASRIARYLEDYASKSKYSQFTDYMPAENVKKKLVKRFLYSVEQQSLHLLSENAQKDLKKIIPGEIV